MDLTNTDVTAVGGVGPQAGTSTGAREGKTEAAAGRARAVGRPSEETQPVEAPTPASASITLPEFRLTELAFRIEQGLHRVVVQVLDAKTKTVLRSIPPEELLKLAKQFSATRGVLLDERS
jgi:hypothetical protein